MFGFSKRFAASILPLIVMSVAGAIAEQAKSAPAQTVASDSQEVSDTREAWQSYYDLKLPDSSASPWIDFVLPRAVFGKARADLADLRVFDGKGREVPFALRVRRKQSKEQEIPRPRQFKAVRNQDRSIDMIYDLGSDPPSHQTIEVLSTGGVFCRPAQLAGCDDAQQWNALLSNAWLSQYQVGSQSMSNSRLHYPNCRFRYLRVRVFPDPSIVGDTPGIESVRIYHGTEAPSELVTAPAILGPREAVAGDASAWPIDLGDDRVPCQQLMLDVADAEFSRPYVLEKVESSQASWAIARGELQREAGDSKPVEIALDTEVVARRLRLVVQDQGRTPLQLKAVSYAAPARQVVFARSDELVRPVRLYMGNAKAAAPSYAFAKELPEIIEPAPARAEVLTKGGEARDAEGRSFGWATYLGLGAILMMLFGSLALFGRKFLAR